MKKKMPHTVSELECLWKIIDILDKCSKKEALGILEVIIKKWGTKELLQAIRKIRKSLGEG